MIFPKKAYGNYKVSIELREKKTCVVYYHNGNEKYCAYVSHFDELWEIYRRLEAAACERAEDEKRDKLN